MMVLTLWIVMRFDKVLIGQYRELNRSENQIAATVLDAVSNITTVIILRVEKLVFNAIVSKTERPYGLFKRNSALNEVKWFLTTMCCAGTIVIVLGAYFLGHIGVSGGVLFGEVFLLYRYLGNIAEILSRFTNLYSETVQRRASVANAEELSDDFVDENFTNHVLPANWQNLSIEGLRFSYESAGEPKLHLDIVSLKIRRGEKIAFVGESGSGKTTLLKVMRDLYRPSELKLSVDGQEIPHGFDGIARAISLVPQAPEIFTATIRENITLGAEHEDDKILHYTGMAQFTEVVGKLPNGLDSSINEKGVNLSGGEQQRLALSRGLLASEDKDILLFDEPTSSLDATTERKIYRNIFAGFDGKTIVSSIHRLHLLPLFDRICVFDNGQIIATGSFDELMLGCPEFQVLWQQYTSGPE
jgi:ABC-type multidrug transport system fused ATPase/permease subunit